MKGLTRYRWLPGLVLGGLFTGCGGRAEDRGAGSSGAGAPGREASAGASAGGVGSGGTTVSGGSTQGGGALGGGATAGGSGGRVAGGAATVGGEPSHSGGDGPQGGAGGTVGAAGDTSAAGEAGASGVVTGLETLVGDYDVFVAEPPAVQGCSPAWYEPRINLKVYQDELGKLQALPFVDFFFQAQFFQEPGVGTDTVELAETSDLSAALATPALRLSRSASGFAGSGTTELPYACDGGGRTTRTVAVQVTTDQTSPKLRVDPLGFTVFGFTHFGFTLSEPARLPSGDIRTTFSEPDDGAQVVELYDIATNAALPTAWKWALAGPVALARFVDAAAAEGRTIAPRLLATVTDGAGNPLKVLPGAIDVQRSALLTTELDFDVAPSAGLSGNASYHATAEPGAECEQGGCLVLDGPVTPCYGAPHSTFALRIAAPWEKLELRYRVWASNYSVSPLEVGFASGCSSSFPGTLSALPQPDGEFTHASAWTTATLSPCGGPEAENGFTLSLACAEYEPPPHVRVVIERLSRSQ